MALFGLGGKKSRVGLDIGSGLIKLAVVDHSSGEPELTKVAMTPVLADAIVEGEVMDPGVVTEAIRGLLSSAGVKTKGVAVAVGGRDLIIRKIQVDRMKESDAYDVIRWEAQQYVPFDIEAVELDFQILDPDSDGLQMDVLLVAAKRELVENKITLLSDSGLKAETVDVDAFALHNAFAVNYPEAMEGVCALVNIGNETTNVNFVVDGVPLLTRDLNIGTRKFREDLQRGKAMGAEEADEALRSTEQIPELAGYVTTRADEIAIGFERAAAFLQTAGVDAGKVQRFYMSGGGARINGIVEALGSRLGVSPEVVNPVQRLKVREGVFDDIELDEVAPLLLMAIGLGLRQA
ncbi:MAG: type IV pilus assembly protein PilM [Gemmatimonadetes bacterium]|nr:type IV pilus assembly protein PilM [Gemmatimonadota bacterium]